MRYNSIKGQEAERLVSGSDDFTLFLWQPSENKKPVARMTGDEDKCNLCTVMLLFLCLHRSSAVDQPSLFLPGCQADSQCFF